MIEKVELNEVDEDFEKREEEEIVKGKTIARYMKI